MDNLGSSAIPTALGTGSGSPFMRLPTEIREMILHYLLTCSYTTVEHRTRSKEYDMNRQYIQKGSDQAHRFYTAIMRTNRTIHEESVNLCRRENDFVCLTSSRPSYLAQRLEERGLQLIAQGPQAYGFWNISMTITLDPTAYSDWPACQYVHSEDNRPWKYIFCYDELPTFCRLLLKLNKSHDGGLLRNTAIHVDINGAIWNGQSAEMDRSPGGLPRIQKLLDPLHQLHSFGAAQIEGPLSSPYKGSVNASLCKDCPTAMDIVQTAILNLSQGDFQLSRSHNNQAIREFKVALNYVRSCCWFYDERDIIMDGGPFPGLKAEQVMRNLKVRLQARIASVYLSVGMSRMARIYTERAMDPRRPYDDRHNKMYHLVLEPWQRVVYAEVLQVSAQIWYTYGHVDDAVGQLREAGEYVPFNPEQQCRQEAWQKHADSLRKRHAQQAEAQELQRQREGEKVEGIGTPTKQSRFSKKILTLPFTERFLVVCNWKRKGDRLLSTKRSDLAASTYKKTLFKVEMLSQQLGENKNWVISSGPFESYRLKDGINAIRFKLQASVAASYLMSERYNDIGEWVDHAMECNNDPRRCNHQWYEDCRHSYIHNLRDWAEDRKLDYQRLYYCRALALHHLGDTVRAIEHMKRALVYHPRDRTVFAQLVLLKQKSAASKRKAIWLNASQDQLRKKQEKRRSKARR